MYIFVKNFLLRNTGEGLVSNLLWIAVTAIVSGTIAYSVWNSIATQTGSVRTIIDNTIK